MYAAETGLYGAFVINIVCWVLVLIVEIYTKLVSMIPLLVTRLVASRDWSYSISLLNISVPSAGRSALEARHPGICYSGVGAGSLDRDHEFI